VSIISPSSSSSSSLFPSDGITSANISKDRASLRRSSDGPPTVYRCPANNGARPLPTTIRPSTARQPRRQRLVADDRQCGTGTYFTRRRSSVLIHRRRREDGVHSSINRSTGAEWTSCSCLDKCTRTETSYTVISRSAPRANNGV